MQRFFASLLFLITILSSQSVLSQDAMDHDCHIDTQVLSINSHDVSELDCLYLNKCCSLNCSVYPQLGIYKTSFFTTSFNTATTTLYTSSLIEGFSNIVERPPKFLLPSA